jgi:O-antigen/teichoic acid export membrane protein
MIRRVSVFKYEVTELFRDGKAFKSGRIHICPENGHRWDEQNDAAAATGRQAQGGGINENGDVAARLKIRAVRGGAVTIVSQVARFMIYTLSTMILARLLTPEEFGLVGMVSSVTGFLGIFKDAGLSAATVQRETITQNQVSTLFWINMAFGLFLALLCAAIAPAVASFYKEPRLLWIMLALSCTFIIGALGAQHQALLRRKMRFGSLGIIDILAITIGMGIGVGMALRGFGYWALVGGLIATTITEVLGAWIASLWWPGMPRRGSGIGPLIRFGGLLTGVNVMNYLFRSADSILIGWRCGAGQVGLYQKAYGLLVFPINQINSPISNVAVVALSRVQTEPERLRRYFLSGYSVVAFCITPIVFAMLVFAEDLVLFILGPQWSDSVPIFRLLGPAALAGALLNPMGWLLIATGRPDKQLKMSGIGTVLFIFAYSVGLFFGPKGVAIGYSIMSCILAVPVCFYATQGTSVRPYDMLETIRRPIIASVIASAFGFLLKQRLPELPASVRGIGGCMFISAIYLLALLVVMGQWRIYLGYLKQLRPES